MSAGQECSLSRHLSAVHEIDDVQQGTSLHPGSFVIPDAMAIAARTSAPWPACCTPLPARVSTVHEHRRGTSALSLLSCDGDLRHAGGRGGGMRDAGPWCGANGARAGHRRHVSQRVVGRRQSRSRWVDTCIRGSPLSVASGRRSSLRWECEGRPKHRRQQGISRGAGAAEHAPGETWDMDAMTQILVSGLGERWAILRSIFKRYPFCLGCFEPLEGLRHLLGTSLDADQGRRDRNAVAGGNVDPHRVDGRAVGSEGSGSRRSSVRRTRWPWYLPATMSSGRCFTRSFLPILRCGGGLRSIERARPSHELRTASCAGDRNSAG